jgi:serine/threonine protein kinase
MGSAPYMAPVRVEGKQPYSYEVDFWSLGITLIVVLTGQHPYPLRGGLLLLMNAIMKGPAPTLDHDEKFPADARDFVTACLSQPTGEATAAAALLNHPFILAAKERGVISDSRVARLSTVAIGRHAVPQEVAKSLVDISVAWKLEHWFEEDPTISEDEEREREKVDPLPENLDSIRFSPAHEAWLAKQLDTGEDNLNEM